MELSSFTKIARSIEAMEMETKSKAKTLFEMKKEELVHHAYQIVTRGARLVDVWEEWKAEVLADSLHTNNVPPTPPAERAEFEIAGMRHMQSMQPFNAADTANTHHFPAMSGKDHAKRTADHTNARPHLSCSSHSSQTYRSPSSIGVRAQSSRSVSAQSFRHSISHRISCSARPEGSPNPNLASVKLEKSYNEFLGFLGFFLGLHLQSRLSPDLLQTTSKSIVPCRDMLKVVDEIAKRDLKHSQPLRKAHDDMYKSITYLGDATKSIFHNYLSAGEDDDVFITSQGHPLMDAATTCVRTAGVCLAQSQRVLERVGDFEFEPLALGTVDVESVGDSHLIVKTSEIVEDTGASNNSTHTIFPPQPSSRPPPPPIEIHDHTSAVSPLSSPSTRSTWPSPATVTASPTTPNRSTIHSLLPPLKTFPGPLMSCDDYPSSIQSLPTTHEESDQVSPTQPSPTSHEGNNQVSRLQTDAFEVSSLEADSTLVGSLLDSETSPISQTSTRAISPDRMPTQAAEMSSLTTSFSGSQITLNDCEEVEAEILEKTYAHELMFNGEGQINGGSLPALIERLTTYDSTPDATFVSTFFLTFRLFAKPTEFASTLIDRFHYVGESPRISYPVRLRVYNVFKGWLDSHWRHDCDGPALDLIIAFANQHLILAIPSAGKRLAELAEKVSATAGSPVPRLVSSMGKTNTSILQYVAPNTPMPAPVISKSQLTALKNWKLGGASMSILDFDPMELVRQLAIKDSRIFCSILPEELLATEWMKKSGSMAMNVRAMSGSSNDLNHLVADTVLQPEDPRKRAAVIKQWVKIATKCDEVANFHSLFAIVCALNMTAILRLNRTWEYVSSKTKAALAHLKGVIDHSRNHASIRQRLQNCVPPCLPFLGTYLTDLTFVDAGNMNTRPLPVAGSEEGTPVINFDKHMKTAKIISELQRFQIPYRYVEVPELQTWIQDQLVRVRSPDDITDKENYTRSCHLEPRESTLPRSALVESQTTTSSSSSTGKGGFDFFTRAFSHRGTTTPRASTPH